ncbi:DUF4326 domain-containing protein [Cryobacterium soli]|uniref:DUF4326 domain-containing protein n=1 Tax=Cryobacterium soli TaxID=2220095 RepID=UPI000E741113|nr:DUF4326 domain-containing protein [Cryobacterium soli]
MPKRIQMSRQKPWRAENPDAVIVARPSKWGNPVSVADIREDYSDPAYCRQVAVELFEDGRAMGDWPYPSSSEIRAELAGKDLACWCPIDGFCHADVLLEIANRAVN